MNIDLKLGTSRKLQTTSRHNVFGLEYGAYDAVARMAAELGGVYTKALGYVPEYFLHPSRFNPNSFGYHGLISMKARQSAAPFR